MNDFKIYIIIVASEYGGESEDWNSQLSRLSEHCEQPLLEIKKPKSREISSHE